MGAGTGHGISGKGAFDNINREGMEPNWRQDFAGIDAVDGGDSSEDNGTEGYSGLIKVGGSHMNMFVCSIVNKRSMITASNIAYHDCQDLLRHGVLHFNGVCGQIPDQFSLKADQSVESRVEENCCERRFESRVERCFDRAGFSSTCEITTGSDAG